MEFIAIPFALALPVLWFFQSRHYTRRLTEASMVLDATQEASAAAIADLSKAYNGSMEKMAASHEAAIQELQRNHTAASVFTAAQHSLQVESMRIAGDSYEGYADILIGDDHDWRIGGKEARHGHEPMIRYECSECKAAVYAPEGTL